MNDQQFNKYLFDPEPLEGTRGGHGISKKNAHYLPPERMAYAIDDPWTDGEKHFKKDVEEKFNQKYGSRGDKILTASMVLCINNEAFQNRLNGTIKDEWLTINTFEPILSECIFILENLAYPLAEYQYQLIKVFKEMYFHRYSHDEKLDR